MISPDMQKGFWLLGHFRLELIQYYITWQVFCCLCLLSSLLSAVELLSVSIDIKNCFPCISMDTLIDSSNRIWHLCGASRTFSEYLSPFPSHCFFFNLFLYFFQQPAPLNWRIWVTWITRGLLDTEAPSGNTPPLRALMMTWKVFILF